jgi:hypothetical protein
MDWPEAFRQFPLEYHKHNSYARGKLHQLEQDMPSPAHSWIEILSTDQRSRKIAFLKQTLLVYREACDVFILDMVWCITIITMKTRESILPSRVICEGKKGASGVMCVPTVRETSNATKILSHGFASRSPVIIDKCGRGRL